MKNQIEKEIKIKNENLKEKWIRKKREKGAGTKGKITEADNSHSMVKNQNE